MKNDSPIYDVTSVDSMQWNRTMQVRVLDALQGDETTHDVEITGETLDAIKEQIKKQIQTAQGELKILGITAETSAHND